jgi:F0F1-type ATP synthase membrane subunit c/vacuolar-type H+-ATPase subunit K
MNDHRLYDDETAGQVLRRAAELQHESHVPTHAGDGLSAADLEQIATEAGIEPAFVRQAMAEARASSPESAHSRFLGEVKTLESIEVLEGEVSLDCMDRMLEEVQRAFADGGTVTRTGRSATWTASRTLASSRLSSLVVAITARDGQTEVRITERLDNLSTALFVGLGVTGSGIGIGISGTIGMGEFGSLPLFAAMAVTAVTGFFATARTLYTRSTRKRRRELQRLLGRLVDVSMTGSDLAAIPEEIGLDSGVDPSEA